MPNRFVLLLWLISIISLSIIAGCGCSDPANNKPAPQAASHAPAADPAQPVVAPDQVESLQAAEVIGYDGEALRDSVRKSQELAKEQQRKLQNAMTTTSGSQSE